MIPNPLPFLAYMAGRTSRVGLGSMVVVLPWHYAKIADRLERSGKDDAAQFYIYSEEVLPTVGAWT